MIKLACGVLCVVAVAACSNNGLGLAGGSTLMFAPDSVTHGGSDLHASSYIDTATVLIGTSVTSLPSTSSTSSTESGAVKCTAAVSDGTTSSGAKAVQLILTCPRP
jgi:hypothetical protein